MPVKSNISSCVFCVLVQCVQMLTNNYKAGAAFAVSLDEAVAQIAGVKVEIAAQAKRSANIQRGWGTQAETNQIEAKG